MQRWNARWAGQMAGGMGDRGYFQISVRFAGRKRHLKSHRIVFALMHGRWPTTQIDHKNGLRDDNEIGNLREATNAENVQNRTSKIDNTSGFPGVSKEYKRKWRAEISAGVRRAYLGSFDTREAAFLAYLNAKADFHPFAPDIRDMTGVQAILAAHARIWRGARQALSQKPIFPPV